MLGLGPQEIVEKIKALSPARSRGGATRAAALRLLLLRFADTLPIRAAPALLLELVSRLPLLHRAVHQAIHRSLLVQPAAHLRPAPSLTELRPALPVNVPADARHAGRVRGGLLVARRLAARIVPEVVALDHRDAHVVGQGVLRGVLGAGLGGGWSPQQGAERPPFPVLLLPRRRDGRSGPLPLVTRRRQSVVAHRPLPVVDGRGDHRGPLSLVRGGRHRGARPLSLRGERRAVVRVQLLLPLPGLPPGGGRGEQYQGAPERVLVLGGATLGRVFFPLLDLEGGVFPVIGVALAVAERRRVPYSALLCSQLLLVVEGGVRATQTWTYLDETVIVALVLYGFQRLDAVLNGAARLPLQQGRRLAGRVLVMGVGQLEARLLEQRRGPRPVPLARGAALQTRETRRVSQARGRVSRLTHSQHLASSLIFSLFDLERGRSNGERYFSLFLSFFLLFLSLSLFLLFFFFFQSVSGWNSGRNDF